MREIFRKIGVVLALMVGLLGMGWTFFAWILRAPYPCWTLDKNPPAPVISRAQCRTFKISQSGREAAPEP
jgi:hypothetical protein